MRTIIVVVILFIITSTVSFAFQNEPDGFRGIKWGTDIGDLPRMEYLRDYITDFGGIKIYINKEDELKIGDAAVSEIKYYFWKNKFYKVSASTNDLLNSGTLQHSCIDNFGDQVDFVASAYVWRGLVTKIMVTNPDYNGGLFLMESVYMINKLSPLERQRDSERASKGW